MKRRYTQALGNALIFTTFGCLFASYGVYSLGRIDLPWLLAIPLAIAVVMILVLGRYQKKVEALPPEYAAVDPAVQRRDARERQQFTIVNAILAIAILGTARFWSSSSTPEYLAPTCAAIVGLAFVALAMPMKTPALVFVGGSLCLFALGVVFAVARGSWAPVLGLGGAAILWVCYVIQLRLVLSEL
jgi:hypothetical protein